MGRERKGYLVERKGIKYIRMQFADASGRKRDILRKVKDSKNWRKERNQLLLEIDQHGTKPLDAHTMLFSDLADYFEREYVKPAVYVEGRKVEGYRSCKSVRGHMKTLRAHFDKRPLRSITYGDIRTFKGARLRTPVNSGKQRTIASVNRELALLRRMFNVAVREGWLLKNPFHGGEPLISTADEKKRERILTRDEEQRMLEACDHPKRRHLRPLLIYLLDTGCRQGEAFKLQWRDVDFDNRLITIKAFNTKTMRERQVGITGRLYAELERLRAASNGNLDARVFGIKSNVRKSFAAVCKAAETEDGLRRHDLRHSHGSRLDDLGFSLAKIGAQLGHTQLQTTLRYVNRDKAGVRQVAAALDSFNGSGEC